MFVKISVQEGLYCGHATKEVGHWLNEGGWLEKLFQGAHMKLLEKKSEAEGRDPNSLSDNERFQLKTLLRRAGL